MTKRCDDCLFAVQRKDELWECRYHPPMPNSQVHEQAYDNWRLVNADFWCSKHDSRKYQEEMVEIYRKYQEKISEIYRPKSSKS